MFESTLTASNPQGGSTRRLAVLPAALAVHALALGAVALGQLWAVEAVPDPPVLIVAFVDFRPPPPPPQPQGSKGDRSASGSATHPRVTSAVQPRELPSEPPDSGSRHDPDAPGGVPDGVPGGVPGGVTPEPDTSPEAPAEPIYRVDLVMTQPVPVLRAAPVYPEVARHLRREGTVVVEAVIDRHGNVVGASVLKDPGFGMAEAALAAIRAWRYEPATLDGRPVSVYLTVTVSFELR